MKELNFLGIGGAINTKLGGNCCYLKDGDKLLIIDACEDVTNKLINSEALKGVKKIYVVITHTHYDHVAGLGVLIWYLNFVLKIKPYIIYSSNRYKRTLKKLFKITGVHTNLIEFIHDYSLAFGFKLKLLPTKHSKGLQCFGIMFEDNKGKYYYTGDTKDIDFVLKLSIDDSIKKIYCEVATETFDAHIKYDDLKDVNKDKFVLMHFNTIELYEKAKKDGFKVATLLK